MNVDTGQLATWQIAIYWTVRPWQEPPRDGSSLDDLLRYASGENQTLQSPRKPVHTLANNDFGARYVRFSPLGSCAVQTQCRPATERYDITATIRLQSADGTS
jgi:hypothetical protein